MQKSLYRGIQQYLSRQASTLKNLVVCLLSYSGSRQYGGTMSRTHITRTLGKVTAVTKSTEPITADQIVTLKTWLDQIEQKRAVLEDLDSKIANAIEEEDELTGETCEVEEYKIVLLERIALLKSFIASHEFSFPPSTVSPAPQQLVSSSVPSDPPANLQSHEPPSNQSTSENEQPPPTGDPPTGDTNTYMVQ